MVIEHQLPILRYRNEQLNTLFMCVIMWSS